MARVRDAMLPPQFLAPKQIDFADTEGSACGSLLPTGNVRDLIDGIPVAMAPDERRARMARMRQAVREHNIYRWAGNRQVGEGRMTIIESPDMPDLVKESA